MTRNLFPTNIRLRSNVFLNNRLRLCHYSNGVLRFSVKIIFFLNFPVNILLMGKVRVRGVLTESTTGPCLLKLRVHESTEDITFDLCFNRV